MAKSNKDHVMRATLESVRELNDSAPLQEDVSYWGDIAITFKNGQHLLLAITQDQMEHVTAQLKVIYQDKFIHLISLDNRALSFNYSNVAEIYLSSDESDLYGPENDTPDYLPPPGLTRFWEVVAILDSVQVEERIEDLSLDVTKTNKIIKKKLKTYDSDRVTQRLNNTTWGLICGLTRVVDFYDDADVFSSWLAVISNHVKKDIALTFMLPDGPRSIRIYYSALNYIWFPLHKLEGPIRAYSAVYKHAASFKNVKVVR